MTLKKQRGRKSKGYFFTADNLFTGDNQFIERQVEKIIALKTQKEAFLTGLAKTIGTHLRKARIGMCVHVEDLSSKIGVNMSQLHKYQTGETAISTSRFFFAILHLFNHKPLSALENFIQSLVSEMQEAFNEENIVFKRNFKIIQPNERLNNLKMHIEEQMVTMNETELKNIIKFLKTINKDKVSVSKLASIEEI